MEDQHRVTILKALQDGINAARRHRSALVVEYDRANFLTGAEGDFEAQINTCDELIKDLADALRWTNGNQYNKMKTIYEDRPK